MHATSTRDRPSVFSFHEVYRQYDSIRGGLFDARSINSWSRSLVAANNVRLLSRLESIRHIPFQQTCAARLLRFQLTADPMGRTFARRVQKIMRNETRMQGVGDAQAYGVLPPIERQASTMPRRCLSAASRTAYRRRNTATSRANGLVHRPPSHTCKAVQKKPVWQWRHPTWLTGRPSVWLCRCPQVRGRSPNCDGAWLGPLRHSTKLCARWWLLRRSGVKEHRLSGGWRNLPHPPWPDGFRFHT